MYLSLFLFLLFTLQNNTHQAEHLVFLFFLLRTVLCPKKIEEYLVLLLLVQEGLLTFRDDYKQYAQFVPAGNGAAQPSTAVAAHLREGYYHHWPTHTALRPATR